MACYLAFLRAINVAGHAIIRMTDLRNVFRAAGCTAVETFIQSGNVAFCCPEQPESLFPSLTVRISELAGSSTIVAFRTRTQFLSMVERSPFRGVNPGPDMKHYVAFLSGEAPACPALPVLLPKEALEIVAVNGAEAFIRSGRKTNGAFGFPNNFVEKELGVDATTRNWTTIVRIAEHLLKEA